MVKGKSDPYAVISVGEFLFKSNVVEENLSPVWNEMYEVREGVIVVLNTRIIQSKLLCGATGGAQASVWTGSAGGAV